MMVKYTQNKKGEILKDGHTMFKIDILTDLKRKAFLETELGKKKKDTTSTDDGCSSIWKKTLKHLKIDIRENDEVQR